MIEGCVDGNSCLPSFNSEWEISDMGEISSGMQRWETSREQSSKEGFSADAASKKAAAAAKKCETKEMEQNLKDPVPQTNNSKTEQAAAETRRLFLPGSDL